MAKNHLINLEDFGIEARQDIVERGIQFVKEQVENIVKTDSTFNNDIYKSFYEDVEKMPDITEKDREIVIYYSNIGNLINYMYDRNKESYLSFDRQSLKAGTIYTETYMYEQQRYDFNRNNRTQTRTRAMIRRYTEEIRKYITEQQKEQQVEEILRKTIAHNKLREVDKKAIGRIIKEKEEKQQELEKELQRIAKTLNNFNSVLEKHDQENKEALEEMNKKSIYSMENMLKDFSTSAELINIVLNTYLTNKVTEMIIDLISKTFKITTKIPFKDPLSLGSFKATRQRFIELVSLIGRDRHKSEIIKSPIYSNLNKLMMKYVDLIKPNQQRKFEETERIVFEAFKEELSIKKYMLYYKTIPVYTATLFETLENLIRDKIREMGW